MHHFEFPADDTVADREMIDDAERPLQTFHDDLTADLRRAVPQGEREIFFLYDVDGLPGKVIEMLPDGVAAKQQRFPCAEVNAVRAEVGKPLL